jgi:chemotaxis protein methyltransferase CheR
LDGYKLTLSDADFQDIARLVRQKAGINLHAGKKELVRARLGKIIREDGYGDFHNYYQAVVHDHTGDQLVRLLDLISTNLTFFFREPKHFAFMRETFLPELEKRRRGLKPPSLRIWSAGCSTGEEPYSIAITVAEKSPFFWDGDFRLLATDLSTQVLTTAARGVYSVGQLQDVPPNTLRRFFRQGRGASEGKYRVSAALRDRIAFRRLNLIEPFPMKKSFDLVFCRNVMIYFDKKIQGELVAKIHDLLAEGGYLFIGHAESLSGLDHRFKYVQPTVYRK